MFKVVFAWQRNELTIRHGNLEVPNILARLPERYTWPSYQQPQETKHTETPQKEREAPARRSPVQHHGHNKHKKYNQPTIEKIDWAQYSRLRNIEQINKSTNKEYRTAFSPSIHVMDGEDQMVTRVQGVGLVVKNSNRNRYKKKIVDYSHNHGGYRRGNNNNRVIINHIRGYSYNNNNNKLQQRQSTNPQHQRYSPTLPPSYRIVTWLPKLNTR